MTVSSPLLVVGKHGQLATSLRHFGGEAVTCVGRPEVDLDHPEKFAALLDRLKPSFVVNAAAWTAVDAAEDEEDAADRANHTGPARLAEECARRDIPFLHVSTDYVFNGKKGQPYTEEDPICPESAYGRTKAAGEQAILATEGKNIILRTAWVYSPYGKNFVKTMLALGTKHPELRVVGDQQGNPTSSDDLAQAILAIVGVVKRTGWKPSYGGIFHATGGGDAATWFELARATLECAEAYGQKMPKMTAIGTKDWPTPAPRPADSRLDNSKLARIFGVTLPDWRATLAQTVKQLKQH
ncbi:dTDP-4-dehydrorhamnose reductase [Saccharibacter floricola]|uniref:dTDP-4-dehydrorhamnose reductase n=1 Tax=Saccharibacter floricola DSM 15669 TaxID=1123227 RepID=A0ABQ0NWY3_9PROT|nr:dTDP-4-dehydrorhamnose reductase [Saccharibacter floricola]GBQ05151.1 dTDP-4-dehydrorhamnose reductase [Saccharibacter floricola DSM 15669]